MTPAQQRAALQRAIRRSKDEAADHTWYIGQQDLPGAARMTAADWAKHDAFHTRRAAEARYVAEVLQAALAALSTRRKGGEPCTQ